MWHTLYAGKQYNNIIMNCQAFPSIDQVLIMAVVGTSEDDDTRIHLRICSDLLSHQFKDMKNMTTTTITVMSICIYVHFRNNTE